MHRRRIMKKNFRLIAAGFILTLGLAFSNMSVFAATTTVTADACKIRKEASTSSDVISSVTQGTKLEVLGATASDDGYTWYQVKDGDNKGYIRADLVDTPDGAVSSAKTETAKTETAKTETAKKTDDSSSSSSSSGKGKFAKLSEDADDSTPASEASGDTSSSGVSTTDVATAVTTAKVSVRSGASTSTSKVASAASGQTVAVSGEAMDADGFTWYQISYVDGDKGVEGFIRSDFLEVTERYTAVEEPEEEEEESEEKEKNIPSVSQDYEVVYEANKDGEEEWFLYDHIRGTKQSIENIHAVMQQSQEYADTDNDKLGTYKIIIIVMAVVIVLLIIGVTILSIKLHDSYDSYDYSDDEEDYDEEEEIEEEEIEEMDEDGEEEEEYEPKKRKFGRSSEKKPARKSRSAYDFDDDEEDEEEEDIRPARRSRRTETTLDSEAWSTDGMLDYDDDMEFEFLDMKD